MTPFIIKVTFHTLLLCTPVLTNQDTEDGEALSESSYKEAEFTYPSGILSERDIPVCSNDQDERIACNVVNKRYFYPPKIERLCRCPDRSECPWEFADYKVVNKIKDHVLKRLVDPYSVMISSRAQMKFCNEVTSLPKCMKSPNETALRVVTVENIRQIYSSCHCPAFKRWRLNSDEVTTFINGTERRVQTYSCDKLPRCRSMDMCGHVRVDTYSTYFLCSCPKNHLCYPLDMEDKYYATEALYNDLVIKSYCLPN